MSENSVESKAQTKVPVTSKGAKTRQKLLDVAEEVFGTKGYFAASIVDITQQAKVAQGTFYNYFESKYEIFAELLTQLSRDFRGQIRQGLAQAKSYEEAQRIGFRVFFTWVQSHRNLYSIVQQAVLVDESLYRAYYERLAKGYVKGLEEAMGAGEFKSLHAETIAYCLMGISQFIGMRWVYWEGKDVPGEVFDDAMTMIFQGLSNSSSEGKVGTNGRNREVD
ncbi:TetR/AcrR family transcriptional regulator [Brevibacillus ruminantium]|uniref:TetR/AcrR family transcriptional regulator n=1 Tax=Brevibacillus ruminantium TaxID=2950604 RepID=A0ABY4WHV0_9BACL|nr:TetR/AcrR family transcriptional regulator [Brevibacillus ruminantium]USG64211.1 TetR/AcrR family transcriptional regulator [Brevibacillus ruminantium]